MPQAQQHDHHDQRQVDVEDQPPGHRVDQVPAQEGPDRGGHPTEPRPRPDGPAAVLLGERRLQDRQAARRQQRRPDALQRPRHDQELRRRCHPAQGRRHPEPDDADEEHPPAAQPVTQRAAQQQQAGQRDRVRAPHPLQRVDPGAELPADGRQGDPDDGGVQPGHARPEDGGREHPPAAGAGVAEGLRLDRRRRGSPATSQHAHRHLPTPPLSLGVREGRSVPMGRTTPFRCAVRWGTIELRRASEGRRR